MDYLQKFLSQFRLRLFLILLVSQAFLVADWYLADQVFKLTGYLLVLVLLLAPLVTLTILPWFSAKYLAEPTKLIWQAILHIAPGNNQVAAPKIRYKFGQDLVKSLSSQLYQMATVVEGTVTKLERQNADFGKNPIATLMPLPLFIVKSDESIAFANEAAAKYIGLSQADIAGKNFYNMLDMSFRSNDTLDKWLEKSRAETVTASRTWSRVRLKTPALDKMLEFDLAAYYNKAPTGNFDLMLILFDHTTEYSTEDHAFNFVAMTVHELRTPLTLLRGYVEAIEEDLEGKLPESDAVYMQRAIAAGQKLADVVNNILNVARIDDDQFLVQLKSEQWPEIVQSAVADMRLRAQVRGITVEASIAPNLPPVAVDKISMYEVICNLLDNAIKYSPDGKKVILKTYLTNEGFIETTIQDSGVGIPEAVMPNLFDMFYRSHTTRDQIHGTGLGLYLCKTIVNAHSGNIWARSKEGQGSIFGFTILPYNKLEESENPQNLTRRASGWIKNHSLYRR